MHSTAFPLRWKAHFTFHTPFFSPGPTKRQAPRSLLLPDRSDCGFLRRPFPANPNPCPLSAMSASVPPFLTTAHLAAPHAMTYCQGGVSSGVFASLNLSLYVGDEPDRVRENRRRILAALGLQDLVSLKQVHGDQILVLDRIPEITEDIPGFDAVISTVPGLALLIQQADCQAVLLHDPKVQVVAAVHSGWRGSVANIIGKTVARMQAALGVNPKDLRAVISPSLGPCCAEFVNFRTELPEWMWRFVVPDRTAHFDFWAMSRKQLVEAGLLPDHIAVAGICTCCNRDFFSFRRAKQESKGLCGRNGSLIGLPLRASCQSSPVHSPLQEQT